jgi:hypothetical protein
MKRILYIFLFMCATLYGYDLPILEVGDLVYVRNSMELKIIIRGKNLSVEEHACYQLCRSMPLQQKAKKYQALVFSQPFFAARSDGVLELLSQRPSIVLSNSVALDRCTYVKHLPPIKQLGDVGFYSILLNNGSQPQEFFDVRFVYPDSRLPDDGVLHWRPIFENEQFVSPDKFKDGSFRMVIVSDREVQVEGMQIERKDDCVIVTIGSPESFLTIKTEASPE